MQSEQSAGTRGGVALLPRSRAVPPHQAAPGPASPGSRPLGLATPQSLQNAWSLPVPPLLRCTPSSSGSRPEATRRPPAGSVGPLGGPGKMGWTVEEMDRCRKSSLGEQGATEGRYGSDSCPPRGKGPRGRLSVSVWLRRPSRFKQTWTERWCSRGHAQDAPIPRGAGSRRTPNVSPVLLLPPTASGQTAA
jgi:hypothetical protein